MGKSKLELIVDQRREDVAADSKAVTSSQLEKLIKLREAELGEPLDLFEAIKKHSSAVHEMFVAAEFKRASPSKGDIATDLDPAEQAIKYAKAGAGLVSVLTEPKWFKGSLDDMLSVRRAIDEIDQLGGFRTLVLRKDFVVDEYQLLEARAFGADTVLLMLSVLDEAELTKLLKRCRELKMEPLVEVVNEEETKIALKAGAKVLGVNNRNLHTFKVDMETTPRIARVVKEAGAADDTVILALSGIKSREDVRKYEEHGGISGLLVGETLMRAPNPTEMISSLVRETAAREQAPLVKICGMNDPDAALTAAKAGADLIGLIFVEKSSRYVTMEKAKEIVQAIRDFRERDGRVELMEEFSRSTSGAALPTDKSNGDKARANGSDDEGELRSPGKRVRVEKGWFQMWGDVISRACRGQGRPLLVGVFMNQPLDEVNKLALEAGVDMIQLHSTEDPEFEAQCALPVIRVVHVDADASASEKTLPVDDSKLLDGPAAALLLDTSIKGGASGGTGQTFDWGIACKLAERNSLPLVMAGGLTPENVAEAVAVAKPWCVDVASGVEASAGVKDHDKIRAFIKNAKKAPEVEPRPSASS